MIKVLKIKGFFSCLAVAVAVGSLFVGSVVAENEGNRSLVQCAAIVDNEQRLKCFDQLVQSHSAPTHQTDTTQQTKQPAVLVGVDAAPARSLDNTIKSPVSLGSQPDINVAAEAGKKYLSNSGEKVAATIYRFQLTAAKKDSRGYWMFYFDNGQVWRQTEAKPMARPRALPTEATIELTVMESYSLRLRGSGPAIKVKRIN